MNDINFAKLKESAKELLKKDFVNIFVFTLLPIILVSFLLGLSEGFQSESADRTITYNWFASLLNIVQIIIMYATSYILFQYVKFKDAKYLSLNGLLEPFKNPNLFIALVIYSALLFLFGFVIGIVGFIGALIPFIGWFIILPALFVFVIIMALALSMTEFILYDNLADPNPTRITAMDAIKQSINMMKGHKWEYFLFTLSFIGWILLIIVTFGLASVWVIPFMQIATILYYFKLTSMHR